MKSRLQKLMAEANVASRRAGEQLIEQGRVRVNGKLATLGDKADPETDVIEVDGERLKFGSQQKKLYFALYKPKQVLTTSAPHRGDERETVLDLLPYKGHLFTIGRLDADSEGLVVLTNDGDLTHRLTHPRYRHTKTYKVTVRGLPSEAVLQQWEDGVWLEEEGTSSKTAPCLVSIVKGSPRETILRITMIEGKKRQIRRVAMALGHPVERLVRTHIGMLSVEGLRPSEWRELTPREIHELSTPSPALKELRSRKQDRRGERGSQPRSEARDAEDRPRRAFGEDNRDQARSQRTRFRSDDDNTRTDERNPRRSAKPSNFQDRQRRSLIDNDEERPRRSSFQRDENSRSEDRPRRNASQASNYQDKPRRSFGDETQNDERPRRPGFRREEGTRSDNRSSRRRDEPQSEERPRRPRFQKDEGTRSDGRPPRSASSNYQGRQQRSLIDDNDERPRRPRYRSDEDETRTDERNPRRSAKPSNFQDRQRRPVGEQAQGDEEQRRPRSQRDENTRSDERPDRQRRRNEDDSRDSNRPRSSNRTSGSRGRDNARGSSGNRSQRNNDRSTGRSNDNRRPASQNNRRGRQGRDNQ